MFPDKWWDATLREKNEEKKWHSAVTSSYKQGLLQRILWLDKMKV